MSTVQRIDVKALGIDLGNFRTGIQSDEVSAVRTMIATAPTKFWGLMDSLLDLEYLPTENIIVLKDKGPTGLVVKEGNRRIACLKLIHGYISDPTIELPPHIQGKVNDKDVAWLTQNLTVPCIVYPMKDGPIVDRIVSMTHGKGQLASRDPWEAIAKARHNRDMEGKSEPALNLFEKYLISARNHTPDQAERWSGSYPLTVLDEAMKKGAVRFGCKTAKELADSYPKVQHAGVLNQLIYDVGQKVVETRDFRDSDVFLNNYNLPDPTVTGGGGAGGSGTGGGGTGGGGTGGGGTGGGGTGGGGTGGGGTGGSGTGGGATGGGRTGRGPGKAAPLNDPKSVKKVLSKYAPRGSDQAKLATLVKELKDLNIDKTPHAFCFVLRSIFEIGAKQYASVYQIPLMKSGGKDKTLLDLLRDASTHLTAGKPPMDPLVKRLHGGLQELANPHGFLSITSLNQLVHNPKFSAKPGDICVVFHNVFPFLEELTK
jgi:hypothetical protein